MGDGIHKLLPAGKEGFSIGFSCFELLPVLLAPGNILNHQENKGQNYQQAGNPEKENDLGSALYGFLPGLHLVH